MKKTWIKLKRGVLKKVHREALGIRIWLFIYMLDRANWDTGMITDWTDKGAADELEMELRTVRDQRQGLEEAGYIACLQIGQRQRITIYDYVNPRTYDGKILNPRGTGFGQLLALDFDESEGDTKVLPKGDIKVSSDQKGDTEGDTEGDPLCVTLPNIHITQITQDQLTDAWNYALGELQATMNRAEFITWVNTLKCKGWNRSKTATVTIFTANRYAMNWLVSNNIQKEIQDYMSVFLDERITIEITTKIQEEQPICIPS